MYSLSNRDSTQAEIVTRNLSHLSANETKPVIIFVHSPKTGGMFIRVVLQNWCDVTNKSCLLINSVGHRNDLREVQEMNESELSQLDMIMGHIPYGAHNILKRKRPVRYMTMLRDPVQQAISAFHYRRYLQHYLAGPFALQSSIRQLNKTLYSRATPFNDTSAEFQLDHDRNALISHLTTSNGAWHNQKGCYSRFGRNQGWITVTGFTLHPLQSMNTSFLLNVAVKAVKRAWKFNCTVSLSPMLMMTFPQFLRATLDLNSTWTDSRPQWDFGNNPTASLFCCDHLWSNVTLEKVSKEQNAKCPRIRNDKTLNCALDNINQMDLILITEKMELSVRLLEVFLNWTIPTRLKHLRINDAVYVTPLPPPITAEQLLFSEKSSNLDRTIYQTALSKFWTNVHSSNILSSTLRETVRYSEEETLKKRSTKN